jgi:hypothetical protein
MGNKWSLSLPPESELIIPRDSVGSAAKMEPAEQGGELFLGLQGQSPLVDGAVSWYMPLLLLRMTPPPPPLPHSLGWHGILSRRCH